MKIKLASLLPAAAFVLSLFGVSDANAALYLASGSDSDGALSASADITLGTNSITIVLTDTGTGQVSSGQTLSGIVFTVGGVTSVTLGSETGNLVDVSGTTLTPVSGSISHWGVGLSSGTTINLETAGPFAQPHQPYDLIVGSSPNANNGFGNFNPYIDGTGTFTLAANGVTSQSLITNVELLFGTRPTAIDATRTPAVPEPSTWMMLVVGFCGLGVLFRRRSAAVRFA